MARTSTVTETTAADVVAAHTHAAVTGLATAHTGLVGMLDEQRGQLATIHEDLRSLRSLGIAAEHRAMTVEQKLAALTATVRTAAIVLGALLLLCLALLSFLLVHHR